jgi:hypothetical protein
MSRSSPGKQDGPLRQTRHGVHEPQRGAARPGGPGDEDGVIRRRLPPLPGEAVDKTGLPRLGGHGRVLAEERLTTPSTAWLRAQ